MALDSPSSETGLCNGALALLGLDERLTDVETEDTVNARRCRLALPRARDALLSAYHWNFAARRASLAAAADAPAWGFTRQFALPPDFLRLRSLRDQDPREGWAIEHGPSGRMLLSDRDAPVDILYTARITAVHAFDPLFTDALTARLAADLAMPVTQTRTIMETLSQLAARRLEEAQSCDAREGGGAPGFVDGSWVESRI